MRRGFWFVAGAGAGVYVMFRARRAAETFTPDGMRDRLAGLGVGAHLFAEEVRAGMTERETELRERLGLALDGPLEIGSGGPEVSRLASLAPQPPDETRSPQPPDDALAPQSPISMEGTH